MDKKDLSDAKPEDAQAWMRERAKRSWKETFPGEPYPYETGGHVMSKVKKFVWLNVSIEVNDEDFPDDESMMDYANELATDAGFIVDDMGRYDIEEFK